MKLKQEKSNKTTKTNLDKNLDDLGLKTKKKVSAPKTSKKTPDKEQKKIIKELVKNLNEKKADDIIVLNLENVNSYLSFFIICTVDNSLQAKSIVRELERKTKHLKLGMGSLERKEHTAESGWSILDLGEIIVHVMTKETRAYYDLDKLWGDAVRVKI